MTPVELLASKLRMRARAWDRGLHGALTNEEELSAHRNIHKYPDHSLKLYVHECNAFLLMNLAMDIEEAHQTKH